MDDLLSMLSTAFFWLGDGATAYATRWLRALRRKPPMSTDPKENSAGGE